MVAAQISGGGDEKNWVIHLPTERWDPKGDTMNQTQALLQMPAQSARDGGEIPAHGSSLRFPPHPKKGTPACLLAASPKRKRQHTSHFIAASVLPSPTFFPHALNLRLFKK